MQMQTKKHLNNDENKYYDSHELTDDLSLSLLMVITFVNKSIKLRKKPCARNSQLYTTSSDLHAQIFYSQSILLPISRFNDVISMTLVSAFECNQPETNKNTSSSTFTTMISMCVFLVDEFL